MKRFIFLFLLSCVFVGCFKRQQTNSLSSYRITKTEYMKIDSNKAIITGFFREKDIDKPISDNNSYIHIQGTEIGASVDSTGFFEMTIKPGNYAFDISYFLFFKIQTKRFKILPNTKVHIEVKLNTFLINCG